MLDEMIERFNVIEECYEFMLAYAAQGLPSDEGSRAGGQIREFLQQAVNALTELAEGCALAIKHEGIEPTQGLA